jgi:hypothetical protein
MNLFIKDLQISNKDTTEKNNVQSQLKELKNLVTNIIDKLVQYSSPEQPKTITNSIFSVQISSTSPEIQFHIDEEAIKKNLSVIDYSACENILKKIHNISDDTPLLVQKIDFNPVASDVENLNKNKTNTVQLNFFHPVTKKKLNNSICDDSNVIIRMPVKNKDKLNFTLLENMSKLGVDPYNFNDPVYYDRCKIIKDEFNRTLTLKSKQTTIYQGITMTCDEGCDYKKVDENGYVECDCTGVPQETGSSADQKNDFPITINYDIVICYKEIFKRETLQSPALYLSIAFFIVLNIAFMVLKNNAFKLIKNNLKEVIRNDAVLYDQNSHDIKYYYAGKRDPHILDKINSNILDIRPKSK